MTSIALSFISLKESWHLELTGDHIALGQFLLLFSYSEDVARKTNLLDPVQQNAKNLRVSFERFMAQYGAEIPSFNLFRSFLNKLPENHYFLIVKGKVTDTELIMKYYQFLTKYHNERGMKQIIHEKTFDWGKTLQNYNMSSYGHQRKNIGLKIEKQLRVCRFCDTANNQINKFGSRVTFNSRSHAFSEALGNKRVTCLDECDACNDRFSSSIEPSLVNYVQVFRSLYNLKGKGGTKKLTGRNFTLDQEGFHIRYDGIIDPSHDFKTDLQLNETFIPQNIYKCLVKFILSVIDPEDCKYFRQTFSWLNGDFTADALPKIACLQHGNFFKEEPMLSYFKKKSECDLPYLIGEFHYADIVFIFIIPFCNEDNDKYLSSESYSNYWSEFNQIRKQYKWEFMDFSGTDVINMVIKLETKGAKLDENVFYFRKDETDNI